MTARAGAALLGPALLGAVMLVAAGCTRASTEPATEAAEARRRWNAGVGAAPAYVVRQQRLCFCPQRDTVRLTVVGGQITAAVNERTGDALSVEERGWYRSVEELFAELDSVPAAGGRVQAVSFHPTEGYPQQLAVDPIPMAVDDEHEWRTVDPRRVVPP